MTTRGVLLIGPYPPPYGGPGVHIVYLRRYLEAHGKPCTVLNIGPSRRDRTDDALPVPSAFAFVRQVALWSRRGYWVHHFFNVESHKAILLAVAAAITARVCGSEYSIGFIGGPRQRYLQRRGSLWRGLLRLPMRFATFVICNNPLVQRALADLAPGAAKVHAIESFHAAQLRLAGELPATVAAFQRCHHPLTCTVVSPRHETGDPHHEIRLLHAAMERLRVAFPTIGCVVVGGGGWHRRYIDLTAERGLSEHFHFAGELSHPDCLAVMAGADVFVRPYINDGSSSSVREALALGIPTVASRNPQHPAAAIQYEPMDPVGLSAAVEEVLTRLPEARAALAGNRPPAGGPIERELALLGVGGP